MKKILHLLPFILYTMFYLAVIVLEGGIENLAIIDVILLLAALLICGLGTLSNKKTFNLLGIVALFGLSFGLIKMGIENTYFMLVETKVAIAILLYYLIIFIIVKNKRVAIMNVTVIGILLLLFVPIRIQYRDGGTIEYRALSYKYIKWNTTRNDGTPLKENNLHWFPHNFHSIEYYKPVESPIVNVLTGNQEIACSKGSFYWSKTVDGVNLLSIADVFKCAVQWTYKDILTIDEDNIAKIDTPFNIRNVKYTEYKEEYENMEIDVVRPVFNEIDLNNENKTIDLTNLENGSYIITFTIYKENLYADYAFKVEVNRQ
ncbi:MAG: hypothetical protein IJE68_04385 [Clostridia bacterium]|nr:hypothetical protein [Clostridia bacterium]